MRPDKAKPPLVTRPHDALIRVVAGILARGGTEQEARKFIRAMLLEKPEMRRVDYILSAARREAK
jgi:hypothetical protein